MTNTLDSTPRQDGFRMPGEFESHAGCWMLWPERPDNWRLGAKPAQSAFALVASTISQFEPVTMCVSAAQYQNARHMLPQAVRVVEMSSNDAWMRDCGPIFLVNDRGKVRGVDWDFNAWGGLQGGLYFPWDQDNLVTQKVLEIERIDRYKADLVLEGGSILADGIGTLLTTEECLLNPNRNPSLSRGEIESVLSDYLNIEKIIWLPRGLYKDETSGHIDNMVCFIRPGVLALNWTDDTTDPQYEISRQALECLSIETDARGKYFDIHKIHQPGPFLTRKEDSAGIDATNRRLLRQPGDRLAGSYINLYIANGGVVVPLFKDPHDQPALDAITELFPERKVVGIPTREILLGGGNIHCITQHQPR